MLDDLYLDLRFGARALRRSGAFTAISLLILIIGIGGTTVVFTLVNSLFLTSPPLVHDPERLVRVTRTNEDSDSRAFTYPDYTVLRDRNRTFDAMYAYDPSELPVTMERSGQRLSATTWFVTANYFEVLGVGATTGRTLTAGEDAVPRQGAVVVISDALWRTAFGADESVSGSEISINGHPFTVVGVAPREFRGASPLESTPDIWIPISMGPVVMGTPTEGWLVRQEGRVVNWLLVVGRLAAGSTVEQARADLDAVTTHLEEEFGDWNEGQGIALTRHFMFQPEQRRQLIFFARLLAGVVAVVLLIVCANIAILQLARASAREREIGVRAALGAGRGRMVRQLLVEGMLLGAIGAIGGFMLAYGFSGLAGALIPMSITADLRPDGAVLAFALAVGMASAVLFGLAPALTASRFDVVRTLAGRGVAGGRSKLRSGLVVFQIAASLVLVTGALLFVRSLLNAQAVDPGFATRGRVFVSLNLNSHGYGPDESLRLVEATLDRLRVLPEVDAAAAMAMTPLRGVWSGSFDPDRDDATDNDVRSYFNAVTPGYFRLMGIDLLGGRDFERADLSSEEIVIVVNRAAAELLWPGESALGRTLAVESREPIDRVIGIVADSNYEALGEEPQPVIYLPFGRALAGRVSFTASTGGNAGRLAPTLQRAIHDLDGTLAFTRVRTIEEAIEAQMGDYRLGARAVGLFGLVAALLAAAGLYGVLSYLVAGQTREIGIRMALGDTTGRVLRRVIGRGLRLVLGGTLVGLALAAAATRYVATMLYGVEPHDPISFAIVPLLFVALAVVAAAIPARRAAGVDPVHALRAD